MNRWRAAKIPALLVLLSVSTGCSLVRQGWYVYATEPGRVERLLYRADQAADAERFERAEAKIAKARALRPKSALLAAEHAAIVAKAGRPNDAVALLEEADRLGHDSIYGLDEPAWDAIRESPRFLAVKASLKAREEGRRREWFDVDVPIPSSARSFAELASLDEAFRLEAEARDDEHDWPLPGWARQVDERRRIARRVAALERFASEHSGDADAETARLQPLRARAEIAVWSGLLWNRDRAAEVEREAGAFVRDFPSSEHGPIAEFVGFAATVAGVLDAPIEYSDDGDPPPDPPLACEGAIDRLRASVARADAGPWASRTGALLAICLDQIGSSDAEVVAAYGPYFADRPAREFLSDFEFFLSAFKVKLRREGPPPFEATTLDGVPVDLGSLKGRVAVLNFWAPT